jgi:hypothetical protein
MTVEPSPTSCCWLEPQATTLPSARRASTVPCVSDASWVTPVSRPAPPPTADGETGVAVGVLIVPLPRLPLPLKPHARTSPLSRTA